MLLGSYRTGDANDPEVYVAGVVRILSAYPMDVVRQVIDPLDGISSKLAWLPKFHEIKSACEEIHGPRRRLAEYEARTREQLAERAQIEDRSKRKTYAEIKADLAKAGIFIGGRGRVSTETVEQVKAKLGITDEQWDAMPDAPPDPAEGPRR